MKHGSFPMMKWRTQDELIKTAPFLFALQGPVSFPCWASLWTSCSGGTGWRVLTRWCVESVIKGHPKEEILNKKFIAIIIFSFWGSLEFSTHFSKPLWALVSFGCHLACKSPSKDFGGWWASQLLKTWPWGLTTARLCRLKTFFFLCRKNSSRHAGDHGVSEASSCFNSFASTLKLQIWEIRSRNSTRSLSFAIGPSLLS